MYNFNLRVLEVGKEYLMNNNEYTATYIKVLWMGEQSCLIETKDINNPSNNKKHWIKYSNSPFDSIIEELVGFSREEILKEILD